MNMQLYQPGPSLSPFVKHYLVITCEEKQVNNVLPDTSLVMGFCIKGKIGYLEKEQITTLPAAVISGLRKSGRSIWYERQTTNFLIVFKEAGAHAFIREPLHLLSGDTLPLNTLESYKDIPLIEEQLSEAKDHLQMIRIVESFLYTHLLLPARDPLISAALEVIRKHQGIIRMKELAASLYISQDAFEKRFRKVTGLPAKQFSYLVRMRAVLNGNLQISLSEMAFNAGYFDQPHFNKDFKLFTGKSPREFLQSPHFW